MFYLLCICISFFSFANSFIIEAKNENDTSLGHGFFIERNLIATSYHVVENSTEITFSIDGTKHDAQLLGYDQVLDIAILTTQHKTMDFYAIAGCKNESSGTLVTALDKIFGDIEDDNTLNLIVNIRGKVGYSGAPFVVKNGVCGILTGFKKAEGSAIIAKISNTLLRKLQKGKKIRKKDLKIYITELTKENARLLNLDLKNIPRGILVTQSENKKIKEWDIITHINGNSTPTVEEFLEVVSKIYQNEEVTLEKITNFEIQSVIV